MITSLSAAGPCFLMVGMIVFIAGFAATLGLR